MQTQELWILFEEIDRKQGENEAFHQPIVSDTISSRTGVTRKKFWMKLPSLTFFT